MNHILVLPEEFETKLNEAHADSDIHEKWLQIGVDSDKFLECIELWLRGSL